MSDNSFVLTDGRDSTSRRGYTFPKQTRQTPSSARLPLTKPPIPTEMCNVLLFFSECVGTEIDASPECVCG